MVAISSFVKGVDSPGSRSPFTTLLPGLMGKSSSPEAAYRKGILPLKNSFLY